MWVCCGGAVAEIEVTILLVSTGTWDLLFGVASAPVTSLKARFARWLIVFFWDLTLRNMNTKMVDTTTNPRSDKMRMAEMVEEFPSVDTTMILKYAPQTRYKWYKKFYLTRNWNVKSLSQTASTIVNYALVFALRVCIDHRQGHRASSILGEGIQCKRLIMILTMWQQIKFTHRIKQYVNLLGWLTLLSFFQSTLGIGSPSNWHSNFLFLSVKYQDTCSCSFPFNDGDVGLFTSMLIDFFPQSVEFHTGA